MGSARLYGTRRLKNRRVIQSLFERPSDDGGVHVIRRGLVSVRYRILTPGRTKSAPGRSASVQKSESGRFQFGVAVGRRTGNAVSRNTVKRILRERVRLRQAEIDQAVVSVTNSVVQSGMRVGDDSASGFTTRPDGDSHPIPASLVMMLVSSGTSRDAAQIHGDTDRVLTALIEQLTA